MATYIQHARAHKKMIEFFDMYAFIRFPPGISIATILKY